MRIEWNCGCQFCVPGKWRRRRSVVQRYLVFPRRIYQENTFLSFGLILMGRRTAGPVSPGGQLEAAASVLFTSSSPGRHHYLVGRWFLNMFTIPSVLNKPPSPQMSLMQSWTGDVCRRPFPLMLPPWSNTSAGRFQVLSFPPLRSVKLCSKPGRYPTWRTRLRHSSFCSACQNLPPVCTLTICFISSQDTHLEESKTNGCAFVAHESILCSRSWWTFCWLQHPMDVLDQSKPNFMVLQKIFVCCVVSKFISLSAFVFQNMYFINLVGNYIVCRLCVCVCEHNGW